MELPISVSPQPVNVGQTFSLSEQPAWNNYFHFEIQQLKKCFTTMLISIKFTRLFLFCISIPCAYFQRFFKFHSFLLVLLQQ